MSNSWSFEVFTTTLSPFIDRVEQLATSQELRLTNPLTGEVVCWDRTGEDIYLEDGNELRRWFRLHDGMVQVWGPRDQFEFDISIKRRDESISDAMRQLELPDRPIFDTINISVDAAHLHENRHESGVLDSVISLFKIIVLDVNVVAGISYDEYLLEETLSVWRPQQEAANGGHPSTLYWLNYFPPSRTPTLNVAEFTKLGGEIEYLVNGGMVVTFGAFPDRNSVRHYAHLNCNQQR